MTRRAIRYTLSAFAAAALLCAFASSKVSANELQNTERELVDALQTMHRGSAPAGGCYTGGLCLNPTIFDSNALSRERPQEPSPNRQFTRIIVKKLDKVR